MTDAYLARVEELPWVDPAPRHGLLEVFRRRYLLRLLVRREISARYSGSFLGLIWSYINPLSQLFIYWFVMQKIIGRGGENFAVHVFSAIVVVHFFTETFNAGTRSIVRNKAIVRKMAMPTEMFPVASMLVSLYHVGPQLLILMAVCLPYGWAPDPQGMLAFGLALAISMVLGTALALLFSAANVFFRDWASAVNIMTNFVRFGAPMIYPYSIVDERFGSFADYYLINPVANAVLLSQRAFWVGTTDDPDHTAMTDLPDHLFSRGLVVLGACVLFLVVAQMVFAKLEHKIPERI
jgi:ABC-2 type transport system permease protein